MRSSKSEIQERRNRIFSYLLDRENASIEELAGRFSVSTLTIRRDIEDFRAQGKIDVYNGVVKVNDSFRASLKSAKFSQERMAIQKKAAEFFEDRDVVFINTSYTALGAVSFVHDIFCTVITNNTRILDLEKEKGIVTIMTGGEVREPRNSMSGEFAVSMISHINASKCFVGVDGVSLESGLSASILHEATITEAMLKNCSGRRYLMVTSDRLNKTDRFFCGNLNLVDCLITDFRADALFIDELRQRGIEVIVAS